MSGLSARQAALVRLCRELGWGISERPGGAVGLHFPQRPFKDGSWIELHPDQDEEWRLFAALRAVNGWAEMADHLRGDLKGPLPLLEAPSFLLEHVAYADAAGKRIPVGAVVELSGEEVTKAEAIYWGGRWDPANYGGHTGIVSSYGGRTGIVYVSCLHHREKDNSIDMWWPVHRMRVIKKAPSRAGA